MLGDRIPLHLGTSTTTAPLFPVPGAGVQQWFVAYVNSRHEKSVARQLDERCIERFLPLYETMHRWRNGRHRVHLPLFPGYVFVRVSPSEKSRVLEVHGVNYIVGSHGTPTALRQEEIEQLRNALREGVLAQPVPYLKIGTRVEICKGPLRGMIGLLRRWNGKFRVVLSVDLIMQSIAVEVDSCDVLPLNTGLNRR